jgi:hypothetical protein
MATTAPVAAASGGHACQGDVVLVVRLDSDLDHIAVLTLAILFDIDAGQELDAV